MYLRISLSKYYTTYSNVLYLASHSRVSEPMFNSTYILSKYYIIIRVYSLLPVANNLYPITRYDFNRVHTEIICQTCSGDMRINDSILLFPGLQSWNQRTWSSLFRLSQRSQNLEDISDPCRMYRAAHRTEFPSDRGKAAPTPSCTTPTREPGESGVTIDTCRSSQATPATTSSHPRRSEVWDRTSWNTQTPWEYCNAVIRDLILNYKWGCTI